MSEAPTDQLYLELDRLHDRPLPVAFDFPSAALEFEDPNIELTGNVAGQVSFTRVGKDVVAHGTLAATAKGICARCLAPAEAPFNSEVDELWVKKAAEPFGDRRRHSDDDEDDEESEEEPDLAHPLVGDRIELREIFRDVILAEIPDRLLCNPDCKGLCPECGADLNAGPCDCAKQPEAAADRAGLPHWKQKLKGLHLDE